MLRENGKAGVQRLLNSLSQDILSVSRGLGRAVGTLKLLKTSTQLTAGDGDTLRAAEQSLRRIRLDVCKGLETDVSANQASFDDTTDAASSSLATGRWCQRIVEYIGATTDVKHLRSALLDLFEHIDGMSAVRDQGADALAAARSAALQVRQKIEGEGSGASSRDHDLFVALSHFVDVLGRLDVWLSQLQLRELQLDDNAHPEETMDDGDDSGRGPQAAASNSPRSKRMEEISRIADAQIQARQASDTQARIDQQIVRAKQAQTQREFEEAKQAQTQRELKEASSGETSD